MLSSYKADFLCFEVQKFWRRLLSLGKFLYTDPSTHYTETLKSYQLLAQFSEILQRSTVISSLHQGSSLLICFPAAPHVHLQCVLNTPARVMLLNIWSCLPSAQNPPETPHLTRKRSLSPFWTAPPIVFDLLAFCSLCPSLSWLQQYQPFSVLHQVRAWLCPLSGKPLQLFMGLASCILQVFASVTSFLCHLLRCVQALPGHSHFLNLASVFSMAFTCSQRTM